MGGPVLIEVRALVTPGYKAIGLSGVLELVLPAKVPY